MQPPKYQVIALLVPRAGAKVLVAIVYSWWLPNDLSIKWLNYTLSVYSNNERKMRPNATNFSETRPNATESFYQ